MQINKAQFVCSSERLSQLPKDSLPEFAFIGRSNVGKSSLVNMLTGRSGLAKVSGTPGKTRLINISASTTVGIWSICPVTVTPAHRKPNATSSPKSSPTTYSDANGCTSCSCWSIPDWSPRRSTCALSKCSAGRASLSASSLPKPTNCRPHSSHAASNATNKCSVNSGGVASDVPLLERKTDGPRRDPGLHRQMFNRMLKKDFRNTR